MALALFLAVALAPQSGTMVTASDAGSGHEFGSAVALEGDRLIVGAPDHSKAYIFERNVGGPGAWGEVVDLQPAGAPFRFGAAVAVSSDTVIVGTDILGGTRAAYIFDRDEGGPGAWGEVIKLQGPAADPGDVFGFSVAIDDDRAVVGAPRSDGNVGTAYVFERDAGGADNWGQVAELTPPGGFLIGWDVAVSGTTVAVLSRFSSVHIFERDHGGPGNWGEVEEIGASAVSIALSGDLLIAGEQSDDEAHLFARDQGGTDNWGLVQTLEPEDPSPGDFGASVALSGEYAAVGAPEAEGTGALYVYERCACGTEWALAYSRSALPALGDDLGASVGISGQTAVAGAPLDDHAAGADAGSARLFDTRTLGIRYCSPAVPNSSGLPGKMTVTGSTAVADDHLLLRATQLPPQSNIGYFIMGTGTNTFVPPGSSGPICVAPGIVRYIPPVCNTGSEPGGFCRSVGQTGPQSILITPGSTWNFQAWHRDGMNPSNLTDAISVTFQ